MQQRQTELAIHEPADFEVGIAASETGAPLKVTHAHRLSL